VEIEDDTGGRGGGDGIVLRSEGVEVWGVLGGPGDIRTGKGTGWEG